MPSAAPFSNLRAPACLALGLALAACGYLLPSHNQTFAPETLPAGAYRLDPEHASLLVKLDHFGFSQLVGRFDRFEGALDFDPKQPEAARLTVLIDPASIDFNLPKFEQDLRGPDWFDVARFPQARFESRAIAITGDKSGKVTGDLTLHGVTAPVTLEVTFNGGADSLLTGRYTLGFAATGTLARSTFGLGAYAPAVGDQVTLEIHAEFQRAGAAAAAIDLGKGQ
jgi:polyisoprenoid-binding protein YceI